jgi:hypothetical protein
MTTITPKYRIQIFHNNQWLAVSFANTRESALRVQQFEVEHGRQARVQQLRFNSSKRIYDTI